MANIYMCFCPNYEGKELGADARGVLQVTVNSLWILSVQMYFNLPKKITELVYSNV